MVNVHKALKNSYADKATRRKKIGGYHLDESLSNHNQQVYFHPKKKEMLYTIAGTHNLSDVGTDVALAFGGLKGTKRYKEADETFKKAKAKYGGAKATVMGHSLGGSIAGYITDPKQDTVVTLDKGATFGQRVRDEEKAYRTSGDYVSLLNSRDKNMKTLSNKHKRQNIIKDALNAHLVDNIKDSGLNH
jgi:hypothetical protein